MSRIWKTRKAAFQDHGAEIVRQCHTTNDEGTEVLSVWTELSDLNVAEAHPHKNHGVKVGDTVLVIFQRDKSRSKAV